MRGNGGRVTFAVSETLGDIQLPVPRSQESCGVGLRKEGSLKYLFGSWGAECGTRAGFDSPLLHTPGAPRTFQSPPFSCMDWSASRGRRLSSVERCGACKPRASTTTCYLCGSRGAREWVVGRHRVLGAARKYGLGPWLLPFSTSIPLSSHPGGR